MRLEAGQTTQQVGGQRFHTFGWDANHKVAPLRDYLVCEGVERQADCAILLVVFIVLLIIYPSDHTVAPLV